jgi:hypothetical protein
VYLNDATLGLLDVLGYQAGMQVSDLLNSIGLNIAGMIFLCLATSCLILSSLMTYQEIGEVNRKLPDDQQIPYILMYPGKNGEDKGRVQTLIPDRKSRILEVCIADRRICLSWVGSARDRVLTVVK